MDKDIEQIPNNVPNYSEPIETTSEGRQNHSEQFAEPFRTVPHLSKKVRNEEINIPNSSEENHRTAPSCSDKNSEYTITVREAARIFEEAGIIRTERTLTNWCNTNTRGITRLDCCYRESQRRYYITPQSINEMVREERQRTLHRSKQNATILSAEAEQLSDHVQNEVQNSSEEAQAHPEQFTEPFRTVLIHSEGVRNETNSVPNNSEGSPENPHSEDNNKTVRSGTYEPLGKEKKDAIKELRMENYELKVQLEGQKYLIRKFDELVDGERDRHEKEKLALVDRLTDARYQIGSLEEKLLLIEAPRDDIHTSEVTEVRDS